jgi:hypothetical protein
MAYNLYPNGGGGVTGDEVAVNKPVIVGTTGHIWYVSSLTGSDAVSPKGREREKPLATFNQAFTNSVAGDVVIFLENHAETIAAAIAVNKALTIVSEGSGSTRAKLTCAVAGNAMLTLSQTGTSLNNIYFPASTAVPTARVSITAAGVVSDNCYFECGASDTGTTVLYGAVSSCQLTNAYFLATGNQPGTAVSAPSAMSGFFFENCTLDGGSFGFSGFAFTAAGVLTAVYANEIHQLNNADVSLAATWTGVWIPGDLSGSARFEG